MPPFGQWQEILQPLAMAMAIFSLAPSSIASASIYSSCQKFFQKISAKEPPLPSTSQLDSFASQLQEVKIAELGNGSEKVPPSSLALVRFSNGSYFRGEIGTIKIADGYHLITIKESKGKIHVIDPSSKAQLFFASPEQQKAVRGLKLEKRDLPWISVDTDRIKKLVCTDLPVNDPEYRRREALIRPYLTLERRKEIMRRLQKRCGVFGWSIHGGMSAWVLSSMAREMGFFQDSYVLQHASNFYLTPIIMGALHSCFGMVAPQHQGLLLGGAVATGVAAQVVEEVNIGDDPLWKNIANHARKESDWEDFSAGIAGVSAYVAGAMILDHTLGLNLKKFCR